MVCRECEFEKAKADVEVEKIREGAIERETLILYGDMDTLPRTKAECPKCGHNEAAYVVRQTRAADEPSTRIYRCDKCMVRKFRNGYIVWNGCGVYC